MYVEHTWTCSCCRVVGRILYPVHTIHNIHTCVPDAGFTTDLWRFSTSTRDWEWVSIWGPSRRSNHVMTSVGLDLWVYGGFTNSGEGDGRMWNTHSAVVPVLRERMCLFPPSVTVCCGVCTSHDFCAGSRLVRRVVEDLHKHVHTRMGASRYWTR
jgi:hypothetical protein